MLDLGTVLPGSTIRIPFSTFDKDDGSSITMTNFAAADILIYKDGSTTERASTSGFTATTDFDSKTGKQLIVIDLADNTTADFYAAGSEYLVALDAVTVDTVTVGGWLARFKIGVVGAILDTTIATLSSQTSFTLTAGPADDSALVGCTAVIHDAASAVQKALGVVSAYTGSTKTVTLAADPGIFTMAAKDNISFLPPINVRWWAAGLVPTPTVAGVPNVNAKTWNDLTTVALPLVPTTAGRTLDVSIGGEAGIDWSNVGSPTTTLALTGTTIATTQKVDVETIKTNPVVNGGTITFPTGATLASTTNITAGTITTTTNLTNLPTIPTNWLTADGLATDAVSEIQSGLATAANLSTVAGYLDTEIAAILADTNELQVDWADGGRLDLILDARASQTSVNTIDDFLDTEIAAIKTVTDSIGTTGSGLSAIPWNASWDAEVQSEVDDALVAQNLDHLVKSAVDTDFATTVHLNSVIGHLADNGTTATYDRTTDSQEAIRDRGDAAWITATGFATAAALATAQTSIDDIPTNAELATALGTADDAVLSAISTLSAAVGVIDDFLDTEVAAIKAKTDNLPADPADASDIASSFSTVNSTLATIAGYIDTEIGTIQTAVGTTIPATLSTISGYIDTEVAAIKAKTDLIPSDPADASDIASLIDALPTAAENAVALLDYSNGIETSITLRQALRLILAASAGELSGANGTTITIRNLEDTLDRIVATVDSYGNRTAIVTNLN